MPHACSLCLTFYVTSCTGSVLLIGDAAHSTGGTLGQGANSALMDVVALDKCLEECGDDVPTALKLFSARQVQEGLALWKLLQLPPKGPLALLFQISQLMKGLLFKFLPIVGQPIQLLLSTTLVPFSEIVRRHKFWVDVATKPFPKIEFTGPLKK